MSRKSGLLTQATRDGHLFGFNGDTPFEATFDRGDIVSVFKYPDAGNSGARPHDLCGGNSTSTNVLELQGNCRRLEIAPDRVVGHHTADGVTAIGNNRRDVTEVDSRLLYLTKDRSLLMQDFRSPTVVVNDVSGTWTSGGLNNSTFKGIKPMGDDKVCLISQNADNVFARSLDTKNRGNKNGVQVLTNSKDGAEGVQGQLVSYDVTMNHVIILTNKQMVLIHGIVASGTRKKNHTSLTGPHVKIDRFEGVRLKDDDMLFAWDAIGNMYSWKLAGDLTFAVEPEICETGVRINDIKTDDVLCGYSQDAVIIYKTDDGNMTTQSMVVE